MLPSLRVLPVVLVVVFLGAVSAASAEDTIAASLVRLTAEVDGKTRSGTGFVVAIDKGVAYILTAKHVVLGVEEPEVDFAIDRSRPYRGEVVENDSQEDLTLLRVQNPPAAALPLAISITPPPDRELVSIAGFPVGGFKRYGTLTVSGQEGTRLVLSGKVSPGNSGGPILKRDKVVGLIVERGRGEFSEAIPGSTLLLALKSWLLTVDLPRPQGTSENRAPFTLTDIEGISLPGLQVARGEYISRPTSSTGYSEITISEVQPGTAIADLSFPAPQDSEWMLLNRRVHVPRAKEPDIHLVAMKRSDFRNFASGALKVIHSTPIPPDSNALSKATKKAILIKFARELGLTELQLEVAIWAFGKTKSVSDQNVSQVLAAYFTMKAIKGDLAKVMGLS